MTNLERLQALTLDDLRETLIDLHDLEDDVSDEVLQPLFEEQKAFLIAEEEARLAEIERIMGLKLRWEALAQQDPGHPGFRSLYPSVPNADAWFRDYTISGADEPSLIAIEEAQSAIMLERSNNEYKEKRKKEYGDVISQLEEIYDDIDAWKARIKKVKEKYPKRK